MKKLALTAAVLAVLAVIGGSATAQQRFQGPCERGPWPNVAIINESRTAFVSWLQQVRPTMPRATAEQIAYQLCDDMSLVGDGPGLTRRLNLLLRQYGY